MIYNKLFPFQKDAVSKLKTQARSGFFLDMGLGKTVSSLSWYQFRRELIKSDKPLYVVCPTKQKSHWKKNINEWLPDHKAHVIKNETYSKFMDKLPTLTSKDVIILSYGKIKTKVDCDIMIIDESQNLKGLRSNRSKTFLKISKWITDIALLSGDPISNDHIGLINQFKLLGVDLGSRDQFIEKYLHWEPVYFGANMGMKPLGPRDGAINQIKALVANNTVWTRTEDEIDLPKKSLKTFT